ncbi:DUF6174 domain-containing protein [Labilibaculum sp.]|uniref:DUF6174 domain-containing protein n=1 Tax=Labilibaculum sp. TaxID=2060723 RepID=UPI003568BE9E
MKNTLFLFMLLAIVSCSDTDDSTGLVFDQDSYDTNRELWENSGIVNYSFSQEYSTISTGPQPELTTVVKNGELDTIYSQSSENEDQIEYFVHCETMDEVFDYIDNIVESCNEAINSSDNIMDGADIEIEYDEKYYYPIKVKCSGSYPDEYDGFDGGLSTVMYITDFEVN